MSTRDGAWDLASHFAIARDCRCKAFQKKVLRQGGHCALGNRALGDTYVDFVFGKISGKSCRAGLDTVVGLDLRKGYVGASWASRRHEPSPRRRGPGPSGRDAAEGGEGGLPPASRTESAARVGAPQPPLPSRGAEIRGKCGADVRNVSFKLPTILLSRAFLARGQTEFLVN